MLLVHGDDDFLVRQLARQTYDHWCRDAGGMDHEIIDAQAANSSEALKSVGRLREALNTLPFFGGAKIVWWQNCTFLGEDRTSDAQAVKEAVTSLAQEFKSFRWENVRLLVSAGKLDKRKALYKTLEKIGAVECRNAWSLNDRNWQAEAEQFAAREFSARRKQPDEDALAELVASVGPHRQQLASEIEKLDLYVGDRGRITTQDVLAIVTRNKQARAFALGDALGERDLPRLLRTLDEELWEMQFDKQKSEIGLLYGLISKVRMMIFLKELQREDLLRPTASYAAFKSQLERIPASRLPEDARFNPQAMNPYPLFKAMDHASKYTAEELTGAMQRLLDCNRRLVSSGLDERLVLQQTLVQILQSDPARHRTAASRPAR